LFVLKFNGLQKYLDCCKGTNPQLGVMIDEFYMSSNSHVNNEKEYENFHGCTFVDVQVLNGVQIEQKKKFMQFTMIS
jgi:hypothetical protein